MAVDPTDPYALAQTAGAAINAATGVTRHDVAVVLGSGWGASADLIGAPVAEVAMTELPGFPPPSAIGHGGTIRSIQVGGLRVLLFLGRVHLYEGHPPSVVAHGVRAAAAAGCHTLVLTNAAGSLHEEWPISEPVLLRDHVNLTGASPLTGPTPPDGIRFVDLTHAYSPRLREIAHQVDPDLPEAVYVGFHGPEFETPAEIRMAGAIGGDLVGMSTVLECIAARHIGLEVLGVSLPTNLAAGISPVPLDGDHVLAAARAAAPRVATLLCQILERLGAA
jgi:purine-nucleoside phosphorylase